MDKKKNPWLAEMSCYVYAKKNHQDTKRFEIYQDTCTCMYISLDL